MSERNANKQPKGQPDRTPTPLIDMLVQPDQTLQDGLFDRVIGLMPTPLENGLQRTQEATALILGGFIWKEIADRNIFPGETVTATQKAREIADNLIRLGEERLQIQNDTASEQAILHAQAKRTEKMVPTEEVTQERAVPRGATKAGDIFTAAMHATQQTIRAYQERQISEEAVSQEVLQAIQEDPKELVTIINKFVESKGDLYSGQLGDALMLATDLGIELPAMGDIIHHFFPNLSISVDLPVVSGLGQDIENLNNLTDSVMGNLLRPFNEIISQMPPHLATALASILITLLLSVAINKRSLRIEKRNFYIQDNLQKATNYMDDVVEENETERGKLAALREQKPFLPLVEAELDGNANQMQIGKDGIARGDAFACIPLLVHDNGNIEQLAFQEDHQHRITLPVSTNQLSRIAFVWAVRKDSKASIFSSEVRAINNGHALLTQDLSNNHTVPISKMSSEGRFCPDIDTAIHDQMDFDRLGLEQDGFVVVSARTHAEFAGEKNEFIHLTYEPLIAMGGSESPHADRIFAMDAAPAKSRQLDLLDASNSFYTRYRDRLSVTVVAA